MFAKATKILIAVIAASFTGWVARAQEPAAPTQGLGLSDGVRTLLQAEMLELAGGSQSIVLAYVSGDWTSIERTAERMRDSYVMKQNLSDAQKQELQSKLPERFKQMDKAFHERAEKLRSAAADGDAELVMFHYQRLLEACAGCHSEFAPDRFPGFAVNRSHLSHSADH